MEADCAVGLQTGVVALMTVDLMPLASNGYARQLTGPAAVLHSDCRLHTGRFTETMSVPVRGQVQSLVG